MKTAHENCTWTILSDTPQSKVTLTFTDIDLIDYNDNERIKENLNSSVTCFDSYSMIRILDGPEPDAPEIRKLCTTDKNPLPIVSNGPSLRIEFKDESYGLNSFTAVYSVRSIG